MFPSVQTENVYDISSALDMFLFFPRFKIDHSLFVFDRVTSTV